jgi:SAM-dependent methyltransferase
VSKRDEDSQSDIEVGMTTAERRRRRRRGAGLRVPSDNVPRRPATAPPVAPVPEDPSLSMSLAYSFTNDASGPHMRSTLDPVAPEGAPTVIDPPHSSSAGDSQDFEMKTREMNAVDLEALGLNESAASTTLPMQRISAPQIEMSPIAAAASNVGVRFKDARTDERSITDRTPEIDVEVTLDSDMPAMPAPPVLPRTTAPPPVHQRQKTVALSEEDLEEVRAEVVRAATQPSAPPSSMVPATPPPSIASATPPPSMVPPTVMPSRTSSSSMPPPAPTARLPRQSDLNKTQPPSEINRTQELQALDIELLNKSSDSDEPLSVPEIDIAELADRAEQSGEIEVDVDDKADAAPAESRAEARTTTPPPRPPRSPSVPPAISQAGQAADRKSNLELKTDAHPPPPLPPKAPPPAPPKKPVPAPAAVAAVVTAGAKPDKSRGKPWFVDLFDEDYLRTLPFLTAQATQAEAEFAIEAMGLAPGAQVLDVGCGYGRHAMELAARGYHVVGLDLSTPLLVRGGEEAHRRGLTINFVRGDMRELDFKDQFDAAYCLFSTFGYFDDETNKKALVNIGAALKPGGKVLIEILNRDYIIADLPTRVWWEGEGCVVLEEVELNYFSSRIQVNRSVVFDDGRQLEQEISVRAYSLHEVGKLMHAAGFRVLEVSGGYQTRGRFFGNQSRHIIVLAERKETPLP